MASDKEEQTLNIDRMPHHEQLPLCTSRPPYRQGRILTSVKAYSVNDESKYLIVTSVPDIKIENELLKLCRRFGEVAQFTILKNYPSKKFEVAFLAKYISLKHSRRGKKFLDGRNFFGGLLHVFYAPELESIEETKEKLLDRLNSVEYLSKKYMHNSFRTGKAKSQAYHSQILDNKFTESRNMKSHLYRSNTAIASTSGNTSSDVIGESIIIDVTPPSYTIIPPKSVVETPYEPSSINSEDNNFNLSKTSLSKCISIGATTSTQSKKISCTNPPYESNEWSQLKKSLLVSTKFRELPHSSSPKKKRKIDEQQPSISNLRKPVQNNVNIRFHNRSPTNFKEIN